MSVGFVFPGQGSQAVGMGRAMAEAFAEARAAFAEGDAALAGDARAVSSLCFEGPLAELTLTANTQPCLLVASVACLRALRARAPGLVPAMVAGHSLGEYTALVAAGALSFAETVRLVRLRGQAMQDAVAPDTGAMVAVVGLEAAEVVTLCRDVEAALPGRTVAPANYNAPGQVAIAGHADAVARAAELVAARHGRAVPLKVSAPFHCGLMRPAADRLAAALAPVAVNPLACPVVPNIDAAPTTRADAVKDLLVRQLTGAVLWEPCVRTMAAAGVDTFVEIGPGRVLTGLIKRIHKTARLFNVSDPESLEATVAALS